jgi:hypothetical protein
MENPALLELLDLEGFQVIELRTGADGVAISVELADRPEGCERCGVVGDLVVKERPVVRLRDLSISGRAHAAGVAQAPVVVPVHVSTASLSPIRWLPHGSGSASGCVVTSATGHARVRRTPRWRGRNGSVATRCNEECVPTGDRPRLGGRGPISGPAGSHSTRPRIGATANCLR